MLLEATLMPHFGLVELFILACFVAFFAIVVARLLR